MCMKSNGGLPRSGSPLAKVLSFLRESKPLRVDLTRPGRGKTGRACVVQIELCEEFVGSVWRVATYETDGFLMAVGNALESGDPLKVLRFAAREVASRLESGYRVERKLRHDDLPQYDAVPDVASLAVVEERVRRRMP